MRAASAITDTATRAVALRVSPFIVAGGKQQRGPLRHGAETIRALQLFKVLNESVARELESVARDEAEAGGSVERVTSAVLPNSRGTARVLVTGEVLRREGIGGLLRRAIRKVLRPVIEVDRWYFFEWKLGDPFPPPPPARVPLEIRIALPEDLEAHAEELLRVHQDPDKVKGRLTRGDVAVLGLVEGRLAHVQWLALASPIDIEEVGVRLFLGPGETYSYGVETLPEWRGHGIHPVMSFRRTEYERALGIVRHVSYVAASNTASLKTIARLGRRRTKTVWTIRLLGTRRIVLGASRDGCPSLAPLP